jgi:hypothetical protein
MQTDLYKNLSDFFTDAEVEQIGQEVMTYAEAKNILAMAVGHHIRCLRDGSRWDRLKVRLWRAYWWLVRSEYYNLTRDC